jgi:nucleoside 2-deoxyribosyltransferase
MSATSVFVAGPFTAAIDRETGELLARDRTRIEALITRFESEGYEVFNAHRREAWGKAFLTPDECTRLDFEEISRADVMIAFPGHPSSPGTHIELGWASALGKPIVLLLDPGVEYAFLVRGLPTITRVVSVVYQDGPEFLAELGRAVVDLVGLARSL